MTVVEPLPKALPGPVAQRAVGGADRGGDGAGGRALEERPQPACRDAQPPDFIRGPDAERPPAPRASIAVAAKDPSSAHGFLPRAAFIKAAQDAVHSGAALRVADANAALAQAQALLEDAEKREVG